MVGFPLAQGPGDLMHALASLALREEARGYGLPAPLRRAAVLPSSPRPSLLLTPIFVLLAIGHGGADDPASATSHDQTIRLNLPHC